MVVAGPDGGEGPEIEFAFAVTAAFATPSATTLLVVALVVAKAMNAWAGRKKTSSVK